MAGQKKAAALTLSALRPSFGSFKLSSLRPSLAFLKKAAEQRVSALNLRDMAFYADGNQMLAQPVNLNRLKRQDSFNSNGQEARLHRELRTRVSE